MKKSIIYLILLTFAAYPILSGCSKNNNEQTKKASILYKKVRGVKHVFANNIVNKRIVTANNGVICFFNSNNDETSFSNAISIIPNNKEDISKIKDLFQSKIISIDYELDHMKVSNGKKTIFFIVDNKNGNRFFSKYEKNNDFIRVIQLSFNKRNHFILKNTGQNPNESVYSVNSYIRNLVTDYNKSSGGGNGGNSNCTSGGPGSTSCSIGDVWSNCSVSCSEGYYACCHGSDNTCECIKEGSESN